MLTTNIEEIPGKKIVEHYGLVAGSTVRAKHVGRDFMAGLKNLVGGELKGYTELLTESRREALRRMLEQAQQLNANAVVVDSGQVGDRPRARLNRTMDNHASMRDLDATS